MVENCRSAMSGNRRWASRRVPYVAVGLTLIELLIAMAGSAVIFLAALQAFQFGKLAHAKVELQADRSGRAYDLCRLLTRDVANAVAPSGDGDAIAWAGTTTSMQFVTLVPGGCPVQVTYRYDTDRSPRSGVMVRATRLCSGSAPVSEWSEHVLLDELASVYFRYGAFGADGRRLVWTDRFEHEQQLPRGVEIYVSWPGSDVDGARGTTRSFRCVARTRAEAPAEDGG